MGILFIKEYPQNQSGNEEIRDAGMTMKKIVYAFSDEIGGLN